jgi:zinc transport system permease protein
MISSVVATSMPYVLPHNPHSSPIGFSAKSPSSAKSPRGDRRIVARRASGVYHMFSRSTLACRERFWGVNGYIGSVMNEFLEALADPRFPFLRYAVLAGLGASVAFGMIGSLVVVRRLTYLADAIAHCVLGGIGLALVFQWKLGLGWCGPTLGAIVTALIAAVGIGLVGLNARQREDTVISAVWVLGVAVGILLLELVQPPPDAPRVEPLAFLFGDILLMSAPDLWLVLALDAVVAGTLLLFYNKFVAVCFDEEFATLRGVPAKLYYLLLLCLTAITVVLLVRMVGILLVVALLALPAAVAGQFARRLWQMMLIATVLCMVLVVGGLWLSFVWDLRAGPTIVVLAGICYLVALASRRILWG